MVDHLQTVVEFAKALDQENYTAARSFLNEACDYHCRGKLFHGPAAIIASYQENGNAAKTFDSVRYDSQAIREATGKFRIRFVDDITHAGEQLLFRCEQLVDVDELGKIMRIEHVDLPGQLDALREFKTRLMS